MGIGSSAAFGMDTITLYSGFSPAGSYTVPLMLVVAPPSQRTCFKHRLPQASQTWAVVSPQGRPFAHAAGQLSVPPQPSPTSPQYCCTPLALLQVVFGQSGPPTHTLLLQTHPLPAAEQSVPQSSEWPQLSPTVPQYWPPLANLQANGVQTSLGPLHKPLSQTHPLLLHVVPQSTDDPQRVPEHAAVLVLVCRQAGQRGAVRVGPGFA